MGRTDDDSTDLENILAIDNEYETLLAFFVELIMFISKDNYISV